MNANECPALLNESKYQQTFGEIRLKFIQGWDNLLTWTLKPRNPPYHLEQPLQEKSFRVEAADLLAFDRNYGYFSLFHPIVGIVTQEKRDIAVSDCLLQSLSSAIADPEQLAFSRDEILAKVLSYRHLKKGMTLSLPKVREQELELYVVDEVIDLWHGMPAFGIVPKEEGDGVPILLYRGTDLSITTEKGWASIMSDLDISGPGYNTYLQAQEKIRAWLEKMHKRGSPARVVGFSLGGVFVFYTLIFNYDLLNLDPNTRSVAFNPPGITEEIVAKWREIPETLKPPHVSYVNEGDIVSRLGILLPEVWELSLKEPMKVIEAHATLMSVQPFYQMKKVDVSLENASRR